MTMTNVEGARGVGGCAYLTEKQVADRLNLSVKWLQKMRLIGNGIPYCKFGRAVRYPVASVMEFELQARRTSTSDAGLL